MKTAYPRVVLALALAVLAAGGTLVAAHQSRGERSRTLPNHGPNEVAQWHKLAGATITGTNPVGVPPATPEETAPTYDLDLATLHIAIYDALALATHRYKPFMARVPHTAGLRRLPQGHVVHGAACMVLLTLYPSRASVYQPTCDTARFQASGQEVQAFDFGSQVARQVLTWRANDGRLTALPPFQDGTGAGQFRSMGTPPVPVNRTRPFVLPFTLSSASQFRADGPPPLTSAKYARDLLETRLLGSATSTVRSDAQTINARFHTMPPPLFWTTNYQQFATSRPTLMENARLMAALWAGHADAITACFESKYHFLLWRPTHAIRLADTDGNPATDPADAAWAPVVPTPNHPEYPAAHACGAGVTAEILAQEFGTRKLVFTFTSTVTASSQEYDSTDAMVSTIQRARIAGGMHFRTATVDGRAIGEKVARQLLRRHLTPER